MPAACYTTAHVSEALGVPQRTLLHWVSEGFLQPVQWEKTRRVPVLWSEKNVREASVLVHLRKSRLSLQKIRSIMAYLRGLGHNPMSTGEFVVLTGSKGKPSEIVKICTSGEAIALMTKHRGQYMLPLWSPEGAPVGKR
jgi:DNA-binding transcriptional MerR regulator